MSNEKSCFKGLIIDNYDRFTQTLSGKDTLHDTVGIAYQTVLGTLFLQRNSLLSIYFNIKVKYLRQQFSYSPQVQQLQSSADSLYDCSLLCFMFT